MRSSGLIQIAALLVFTASQVLAADSTPPNAPAQLIAANGASVSVSLSWSAATDDVGVTAYDIHRNGAKLATVAGGVLTYVDQYSGQLPQTNYIYNISARDKAGNSSVLSVEASVTTGSDTLPPKPVMDVDATPKSSSSIEVRWYPSYDDVAVAAYDIYRNGVLAGQVSSNIFLDTGLAGNTTYTYTIRARDSAGNVSPLPPISAHFTGLDNLNIIESSGISASRLNLGIYWTHNDSFEKNRLYAFDVYGRDRGTYTLQGATIVDWEDMAGTVVKGVSKLVIADTGDNALARDDQKLVVVNEPSSVAAPGSNKTLNAQVIPFHWPQRADGSYLRYNCASVGVFPDGLVLLASKTNTGSNTIGVDIFALKTSLYAPEYAGANVQITKVKSISTIKNVTAMDVSPDGLKFILLNGASAVGYEYSRTPAQAWTDMFLKSPAQVKFTLLKQNTAICYNSRGSMYWGTSELGPRDPLNPNQEKTPLHYRGTPGATAKTPAPVDIFPPDAPAGLVATALSHESVQLMWQASSDNIGVVAYDIYRDGVKIQRTTDLHYTDTGLAALGTYSYAIVSLDAANNASAPGETVMVTLAAAPDTEAPEVPQGLSVQTISVESVMLAWEAATDNVGVTAYDLYRDGMLIATTTEAGYHDQGLAPSTTYSYFLTAKDEAGNVSSASATLMVETPSLPDTVAPGIPTGLTAVALNSSVILVTWQTAPEEDGVASYEISRDGVVIASTTQASHIDSGLTAGTTFQYSIVAKDAVGNASAPSELVNAATLPPVDIFPPNAPQNVAAHADSAYAVTLTWDPATDDFGVTGYMVLRGGEQIARTTAPSYNDTGLQSTSTYAYNIIALDAANNQSSASDAVYVTTLSADQGVLLVGESFDYSASLLEGSAGGHGWAGPWTFTGNKAGKTDTLGVGLIADIPGLLETGNHMRWKTASGTNPTTISRQFAQTLVDNGATVWMVCQVQSSYQKLNATIWMNGYTSSPWLSVIGTTVSPYHPYFTCLNGKILTQPGNAPRFFVFKIDFSGTAGLIDDAVKVYVDPDLSSQPDTWVPKVSALIDAGAGLSGVTFNSNQNASASSITKFDEFRIGTSLKSVLGESSLP